MYSEEMLVKRDGLRHDPMVQSALDAAWERLAAAREFGDTIPWGGYQAMCRKLYLLFKIQRREGYLEASDALVEITRDWPTDSNKKDHMNKEDFCAAFFQLADVHTDDVEARLMVARHDGALCHGGLLTAEDKAWMTPRGADVTWSNYLDRWVEERKAADSAALERWLSRLGAQPDGAC